MESLINNIGWFMSGAIIGCYTLMSWASYRVVKREKQRTSRMAEINEKMDKLCRNSMDYTSGAIEAFLSGDIETSAKFAEACNEEADKIEALAKEFSDLESRKPRK